MITVLETCGFDSTIEQWGAGVLRLGSRGEVLGGADDSTGLKEGLWPGRRRGTDMHSEEGAGWALSEYMHLGVLE